MFGPYGRLGAEGPQAAAAGSSRGDGVKDAIRAACCPDAGGACGPGRPVSRGDGADDGRAAWAGSPDRPGKREDAEAAAGRQLGYLESRKGGAAISYQARRGT